MSLPAEHWPPASGAADRLKTAVFVNDYARINGGASRVAIDEAVALAAAGIEVIFLAACGPVCPELRQSSVRVVCLEQPELIQVRSNPAVVVQGLWNAAARRAMEVILAPLDARHTVVHLHGYTKAVTTSPVRAAVKAGFRVVCTLHDFFCACPNGAFFDYVRSAPCERRALSLACLGANCDKRAYSHKLFRSARTALQSWAGVFPRGVRHYISLSRRSAALLAPYLSNDASVFPVENIVDVRRRPPVPVATRRTIVAVGRLDPEKGCELLADAAGEAGLELVFVGDGALRQTLERHAHVRVTGWLAPAGVEAALDEARALVFPSLWYETYGLVVSEAAARGVPAVCSDIAAPAERIDHGVDGLVFRSGDRAALVEQLRRLADDAFVARLGAAAYERFWRDPPDAVRHVAQLCEVYRHALEAAR